MKANTINIAILACLMTAIGCATPAKVSNMTHYSSSHVWAKPNSKFHKAIVVEGVTGGSETNPMWMSKVSSEDFQDALKASLQHANYLADEPPPYVLSAELLRLKQPFAGFNITVTALVDYVLKEKETGQIVLRETVESPYKAKFGDSLYGVTRLRMANEGAIQANIERFLEVLAKNTAEQVQ